MSNRNRSRAFCRRQFRFEVLESRRVLDADGFENACGPYTFSNEHSELTTKSSSIDKGTGPIQPFNTSTITGVKWNDLNENGRQDSGEPGLPDWTIYVDSNANGQFNVGEPSAVSAADGSYTISGLAAGKHVVSEVPQPGWEQIFPQQANYPIERVSVTTLGLQGTENSDNPSVSADGRYVAFESTSSLVGDSAIPDVFVFDRLNNTIEKISNGLSGALANNTSSRPSISDDGRYVAFSSIASNLVPNDTNTAEDVFVYDRQTQTTVRVSVGTGGFQAVAASQMAEISGNGQFVTFQSSAFNLTAEITNGNTNVYVHEISTGITSLVSQSTSGAIGNNASLAPSISDDGTVIAFESDASNLVTGDNNGTRDIFVRNRAASTTQRVSQSSSGSQALNHSYAASISGNGRYVGFWSNWPSLVSPVSIPPNTFLYDLQNSTIETVSIAPNGSVTSESSARPSISVDGRYVAFSTNASVATSSKVTDVFVRDRLTSTTKRVSRSDAGVAAGGNTLSFAISSDGQTVVFSSSAKHLVPNDTNYRSDIFAVDASFPWVAGAHFVTVAASATASGINFGNTLIDGDLSGVAWQDTNRNGVMNLNEPTINNRQIYIDTNNNSSFDGGETSVLTGATGAYTFGGLSTGDYIVREVLPTQWTEFAPVLGRHNKSVGQVRTLTFDFEDVTHNSTNFVTSGDYVREGFVFSTTLAGSNQWRIYGPASVPARPSTELEVPDSATPQYLQRLDGQPFTADAINMRTTGSTTNLGALFIGERLDGSIVTQFLNLTATATNFPLTGFSDIISLRWNTSQQGITVIDNVIVRTTDWEYTGLNFGSMANPATISGKVYYDTNKNGAQDAGESGIFNRLVYLDVNGDAAFTAGEPSTSSLADGSYSLVTNPGNATLRQAQLANWHETQPGNGYALTIGDGALLAGRDFGSWADPSEIRGSKWNDLNANGLRDAGEPGLVGWTVYIDLNNNAALDANDRSTTTVADNPATTGVDESGTYSFTDFIPGNHSVRDVPVAGWAQTTPASMTSSVALTSSTGFSFSFFQANPNYDQSLSKDGRYVAFTSPLALVNYDTNSLFDVYLLDRATNALEMISISNAGALGNNGSFDPAISDDGRYVAFYSAASNFYTGDVAGFGDLFIRDRQTGTTTLVTVGISGNANGQSLDPMITADGRTLIFSSAASNLIPGDTNGSTDLFVRNLDTGVTSRINPNTTPPNLGNESTLGGDISADGRFVVFQSFSDDIVAGDTNLISDIFVLDRTTNIFQRVSTSSTGSQANGSSERRSISDDGRFIVFDSRATNLTADGGFTSFNIFLKDRLTGQTKLISRNYNGGAANESRRPEISGDGRWITFETGSTTMFPDSANTAGDIIIYDRLTDTLERLTKGIGNGNGGPCNFPSLNAVISRDGSTVSFDSIATNLGPVGTGLFTISRTAVNSLRIPVLAGQIVTAMDVGHYEKTGAISGSLFVDVNGNGLHDVGETGISPLQGENTPSARVYLDTNNNEVLDVGEPTTVTDSNGQYSFTQLMPGDHIVRPVVASQRQLYQTSPSQTSGRLFGVHPVSDATSTTGFRWVLNEINPQNGATIRSVQTGIPASGSVGVAFDGELVQIFANATGILYQFRPDGQLVVQSVVPSTVLFSGLAYLGGLTYYLEQTNSWPVLVAYDPKTLQAVRRMPLTHSLDGYGPGATFPTVGLGLGESADGQSLIITTADSPSADARLLRVDPLSGRVTEYFTLNPGTPVDASATGFGGELYLFTRVVTTSAVNTISVYSPTNTLLRSFNVAQVYHGMGGAIYSNGGSRITLAPQQGNVSQSFGYRSTLGSITGHLFEDRNANGTQEGSEPNRVGATAYLDINQNRALDVGEPTAISDANGNYVFANVVAGNYIVRVVTPAGLEMAPTNSSLRMFVSRQDVIMDLDPVTGATLNQFTAPAASPTAPTTAAGLAFNGQELFYVKGGVNTIFVLNPDTGALIRSFPLPSSNIDGLAEIAGKLYALDTINDLILEFSSSTGTLLRTLNINALNPDYLGAGVLINLLNGLSESADTTKLVVTGSGNRYFVINPVTGIIMANGTGAFAGGAGAAGERSVSYFSTPLLDFFNANEQKVRTITSPSQIISIGMALGDDRGRLAKVARGQTVSNVLLAFRDVSTPTDIALSASSVFEKLPAGAVVGNLSATDANVADLHSFVLVAGTGDTDNSAFQLVGNELRSLQPFDFAVKSTYSIRVRATDASGHTFEKPLTVTVVNIPELVGSIQFGDGTVQRSTVKQIVLDLDGAVDISAGAFVLQLRERDANNQLQLQTVNTTWSTNTLANGNTRVTLSFSGAYVRSGTTALVDGNYQLLIDGSKIRTPNSTANFDGDRNGTSGGNLVIGEQEADNFYSYYGDTNGDRVVGVAEFGSFRQTFGKSQGDAGYDAMFDFDGNNNVGVSDFGAFRSRFGKRLNF